MTEEQRIAEENVEKRAVGWMGNGLITLLAVALMMGSLWMMWMDYRQTMGPVPPYTAFPLRFGAFCALYGLAIVVILCRTADKVMPGLAGLCGVLLLVIPVACRMMGVGYSYGGIYRGSSEGLGVLGIEMASLGYFLICGWVSEKFENRTVRFALFWILGIVTIAFLWQDKAVALAVFLSCLAYTALMSDAAGLSLTLLIGMLAALLAEILYAIRVYDIYQMMEKSFIGFNENLLKVAAWILPSARARTDYVQVDKLFFGAGPLGQGSEVLRSTLPDLRFSNMDFSLLYATSWYGWVAFGVVLVLYLILLWQIYIRCSYALAKGYTLRGCISFGVFVKLAILALAHIGYSFGWLPFVPSHMPLFCFGGTYWLVTMTEIGLVLRISGNGSFGLRPDSPTSLETGGTE